MIERKLFQDTFSALHASEKSIQEVLAMSEEKKTLQHDSAGPAAPC